MKQKPIRFIQEFGGEVLETKFGRDESGNFISRRWVEMEPQDGRYAFLVFEVFEEYTRKDDYEIRTRRVAYVSFCVRDYPHLQRLFYVLVSGQTRGDVSEMFANDAFVELFALSETMKVYFPVEWEFYKNLQGEGQKQKRVVKRN